MNKKLTLEKFIEEAKIIHMNKYDYSLTNYINAKTKIKVICPEQHFESVIDFGGEIEFEKIKLRDKIKTEFCINNNIYLLRIKYNQDIF